MARVIWTPAALNDISRLHDFLASSSSDAARRAVGEIRKSARILQDHPELGRPVREMGPGFREWFIRFGSSGYVALYRHDDDLVVMLAVRHGREAGYPPTPETTC